MFDGDDIADIFQGLGQITPDPPQRRPTCPRCRRPVTVCWCAYLPREPISVRTKVTILQHPYEESRRLRTSPMLYFGLQSGQCTIIRGKKFKLSRYPHIQRLVQDPNTILLFPGDKSQELTSLQPSSGDIQYNLILLDGTWMQARGLFYQNPFLHQIKQVQLTSPGLSEYVIRTQPTDGSLSTLETAVYAIALLENRPDIIQPLLNPLRAMCKFQMEHGALIHHSKQYLIDNGLYKKQAPPSKQSSSKLNRPSPMADLDVDGEATESALLAQNQTTPRLSSGDACEVDPKPPTAEMSTNCKYLTSSANLDGHSDKNGHDL